jgi:hypothetical protein
VEPIASSLLGVIGLIGTLVRPSDIALSCRHGHLGSLSRSGRSSSGFVGGIPSQVNRLDRGIGSSLDIVRRLLGRLGGGEGQGGNLGGRVRAGGLSTGRSPIG